MIEALYKVTNKVDSARLEIFGAIGGVNGFTLRDFKAATDGLDVAALDIDLNSPGGDAFEAFAIYDAIKALSARVTVNIIGVAASAATIIAAAADKVTITENSRYLIHEATTQAAGKKSSIAESAEMLRKIDEQMVSVYVKRTGKTKAELEQLMQKDAFISAHEALSWGFVDQVINNSNIKTKAMSTQPIVKAETGEGKPNEEDTSAAKIKALEAEIEALKAKLAKAMEDKEEYEGKAKAAEEEQADALISAAIQAGKIKAEAKDKWVALAINDRETVKATLEAFTVQTTAVLANVPNTNPAYAAMDKKQAFFAKLKAGEFKTKADAEREHKAAFSN